MRNFSKPGLGLAAAGAFMLALAVGIVSGCGAGGGNDPEATVLQAAGSLVLVKGPGEEIPVKAGDTLAPGRTGFGAHDTR